MADPSHNDDLRLTISAASYFGLHPDMSLTGVDEAIIMQEVNNWDVIEPHSPKVNASTSMLNENNCGEHNNHRLTDWCLTRCL
jgi:hypothetical protein